MGGVLLPVGLPPPSLQASAPIDLAPVLAPPDLAPLTKKKKKKRIALGSATPFHRLSRDKIPLDDGISYQKQGYRVLSSYNLKSDRSIIVPGSPAVYTPNRPPLPFTLSPDAGLTFSDPNRHVFKYCPLEPLIRAIKMTSSDYDFRNADFVMDRRNLRFLLQFCSNIGADREYRIDVECVGPNNTLLVYSNTGASKGRADGLSYGHNFEDAVTHKTRYYYGSGSAWMKKERLGGKVIAHYRACSYTLGGVNICLRFEVDACFSGPSAIDTRIPSIRHDSAMRPGDPTSLVQGNCTIYKGGFLAAPHAVMELKSRKLPVEGGKPLRRKEYYEQLWFSDTPWLVVGTHRKGCFTEVKLSNARKEIEFWELKNRDNLRRLARLLKMIQEFMKQSPKKKVSIIWRKGTDDLQFFDIEGNVPDVGLPEDLKALWQ